MLIAIPGILLVGAVLGLLCRPQAPEMLTSVFVLDDGLRPVEGSVIRLSDGQDLAVVVTDSDGQSPWVSFDPLGPVELTVTDLTGNGGIGLGFVESLVLPSTGGGGEESRWCMVGRTQPFAQPVLVTAKASEVNNIFPLDGAYPHWRIGVPPGTRLRFSTHVAPLLDNESVRGYLRYRGYHGGTDMYYRGTAFVVPDIDLGSSGFVLGIHLLGAPLVAPTVDVFSFVVPKQGYSLPLDPPFDAEVQLVNNGVLYVKISGGIPAGHLGIFVKEGTPSSSGRFVLFDAPPTIVVPEDAGGGTAYPGKYEKESAVAVQRQTPGSESAFLAPETILSAAPALLTYASGRPMVRDAGDGGARIPCSRA